MTHSEHNGPFGAHGECWNLLPWIANESAAAKDLARIEEHLRECRECQEELEFQRRLRDAIRSEEAIVLAPQTSLQKVMQRIDAGGDVEDERETPATADPVVAPRERASWSRWLPIAAAVQGIAIAALLATVWSQSRDETLTAPRYIALAPTPMAHEPVLRVVFANKIALDDLNRLLRSIDAQIIAGPSEAGVYTLGLGAGSADKSKADTAATQLRADSRVMFAEVVVTSEAP